MVWWQDPSMVAALMFFVSLVALVGYAWASGELARLWQFCQKVRRRWGCSWESASHRVATAMSSSTQPLTPAETRIVLQPVPCAACC